MPGADPIIGALAGGPRAITGLDPNSFDRDITLVTDFVRVFPHSLTYSPIVTV